MNKLPFEKLQREVIVRKEFKTNSLYGCNPEDRPVAELLSYGVINIDKPRGPTSHEVSAYVQKILGIDKSGHSGTLDPNVTGVLVVAIGRATRIVQTLLPAGKEYVGIMHLHKAIDEEKIQKVCKEFTGKIKQLPPIKSSVKRRERIRNVYYFEILEIDGQEVLFKVGCQAGTYIRKLCHDIGKRLGCGAHMAELRRTKAGCFDESSLVTLQDLADGYWHYKEEKNEKLIRHCIKPVEVAVAHLPKIWIFDTTVSSICHGADLKLPGISKYETQIGKDDIVAIMTLKNELVALGTALIGSKQMNEEKGIAVKVDKVFMNRDVYPRNK